MMRARELEGFQLSALTLCSFNPVRLPSVPIDAVITRRRPAEDGEKKRNQDFENRPVFSRSV